MKVVHYVDVTEPGGALNQVMTLVASQNRQKTSKDDSSDVQSILIADGYKEVKYAVKQSLPDTIRTYFLDVQSTNDPNHLKYLNEILDKEKPDIIHAHLSHSGACRFLFFTNLVGKTPLIATEHDPFKLSFIKKMVKKFTLRDTTKTIAISDRNREFLQKQYKIHDGKIATVHNGIDIDKYRAALEKQHPNKKNKIIIGSVMELHMRKGPDILIDAFEIIHEKHPETRLFIAGDGLMKTELQKSIRAKGLNKVVSLFGWVNDIPKFLSELDIFMLTSRREAFGLAVLEAQACNVPVIASNVGGLSEIIDDGITGILCTSENSNEFAERAIHLIENRVVCNSLIEQGYKKLINLFSADTAAKNTLNIYRNLIKDPK